MRQFAQIGFPELYERELVGPLFQPWAEHLVRVLKVGPKDRVLDVACGTGIVARSAVRQSAARVVGIDVNPAMIGVAARIAPEIEWRAGDAKALPLAAGEQFDVVACQQGVQFFPDRDGALAEMRRALVPGGRFGISAWRDDEEMPVLRELRRIAERHVGPIVDRRHSLHDAKELTRLLERAGFREIRVEPLTKTVHFKDGSAFVYLNAMALVGMSGRAKELDDDAKAEMVRTVMADSQDLVTTHSGSDGFAFEIGANVATAVA